MEINTEMETEPPAAAAALEIPSAAGSSSLSSSQLSKSTGSRTVAAAGSRAVSLKRDNMALAEFKVPAVPGGNKKRIVLEEDQYAVQLEKIIERDYFPDLEKLNAQNAYLNALANNDIHMLRELYSKYSFGKRTPTTKRGNGLDTPSTFETPIDLQPKATPVPSESEAGSPTHLPMQEVDDDAASTSSKRSSRPKNDPSSLSLNDYLNTYTSEDNQSFQDFMEEADRKHRIKYSWLYDTEDKNKEKLSKSLEVPSIEQQAGVYERPLDIDTWTYRTKNYVMYVPDGVAFTPAEEVEMAKKRAQVIFSNTRFSEDPFKDAVAPPVETPSNTLLPGGKVNLFKSVEGKIGVDGKEVEKATPKVNGFSYVKTPSLVPGVEDSPFMTWGEIEGTPFRLDGGDTPVPTAVTAKPYRIMEQSKRERLAMELAEKVSYRYRDKKLKAIQAARSHLATPSPKVLKSSFDRLSSMSPAAQKFAKSHFSSKIGSSDKALRSSYTPKRVGTPGSTRGLKTPSSTPTPGSSSARSITASRTPLSSAGLSRPSTSTSSESRKLITDDLLQLPKKPAVDSTNRAKVKASDFF